MKVLYNCKKKIAVRSLLSERQKQCVKEWALEKYNMKAVASKLGLSLKTVEFHIAEAKRKLRLSSLYDLAAWMVKATVVMLFFTGCATTHYTPAPAALMPPTMTKELAKATPVVATVNFAWDYETPVDGFKLYQGTASRIYTNITVVPGNASRTGSVTNVPIGVKSYFCITAFLGTLESDQSSEVQYTPALPIPENFRLTVKTAFKPTGPWDNFALLPSVVVTNSGRDQFFKLELAKEP